MAGAALCVRGPPASRGPPLLSAPTAPELCLPVRHQMRARDRVHGQLVATAVAVDSHGAVFRAANRSGEVAPPLDGVCHANLDLAPGEALEVDQPPQGAVDAGRTDLEPVGVEDDVRDVQGGREVPAHPLTLLEADPGSAAALSVGPDRGRGEV